MSQYFLKPLRSFGGNINLKVDPSHYATKTDLKNVAHVDTSSFELKTYLASLKTEVDKLDIDKLMPVPVDLSKLSQNIIISGLDMSSSLHVDNKKKDILIFGSGPRKKFCLSLHYNGVNSYLFVNGTKIYKFKAKDCEIVENPLCSGNISKD